MRNLLISVLVLVLGVTSYAQQGSRAAYNTYVPVTLSAGTAMTARTDAAALDDTTRIVDIRGFQRAGLLVVTATNDSVSFVVSYQGSHDGVTWDPVFVTIDSLNSTGSVAVTKGFPLPDKAMLYPYVRFRVKGSLSAVHSVNPSATITSRVIRKF